MVFAITPIYALPVAAIYLILWLRVSSARAATGGKRRFRPIGISLAGMICDKVSLTLLPS